MELSIKEIMETVKNTPPFHKEEIEASYSGRKISWELKFAHIDSPENGLSKVYSLDPQGYPWVYFQIPIDEYTELKLLNKDRLIRVSGTINNVSGHSIDLENITSLTIIDEKPAKEFKAQNKPKSEKKNKDGSLLKQIVLHPVWASFIVLVIIFIIYLLTGVNLKDYSL